MEGDEADISSKYKDIQGKTLDRETVIRLSITTYGNHTKTGIKRVDLLEHR